MKLCFLIQQRIISRRDLQMLDMDMVVMAMAMVMVLAMVDMVLVDIIMGRDQQIIFLSIKDQLIRDMDMAMENDHWRKFLKMLSAKDQPMQMLDTVLDMDMGLDMVVITMERGLLSLWTTP